VSNVLIKTVISFENYRTLFVTNRERDRHTLHTQHANRIMRTTIVVGKYNPPKYITSVCARLSSQVTDRRRHS